MNTLLQIVLIVNGALLLHSIWTYARQRRAGKPLATYQAGNITGSIGLLLMLLSLVEGVEDKVATLLLIVALVLAAWSITLMIRAKRRARTIVNHGALSESHDP